MSLRLRPVSTKEKLLDAIDAADIDSFKQLLPLVDPKEDNSLALRCAVAAANVEMVRLLLPVSDPYVLNGDPLFQAARRGLLDLLDVLIPVYGVAPSLHESRALGAAARGGHLEAVRRLLPVSEPKAFGSKALWDAVHGENLDVVKLLLPHCDPQANDQFPLRLALSLKNAAIVNVLLPVSDLAVATSRLVLDEAWNDLDDLGQLLDPEVQEDWLTTVPERGAPITRHRCLSRRRGEALTQSSVPESHRCRFRG